MCRGESTESAMNSANSSATAACPRARPPSAPATRGPLQGAGGELCGARVARGAGGAVGAPGG